MNEQKPTPGPWQVELCRVYHNSGKGRRNIAICLASQKPPSDEYEVFEDIANARLIAAAPELLAALEGVVATVDKIGGPLMIFGFMKAARAAIQKAKGDSENN
jgi:hypothetical protein